MLGRRGMFQEDWRWMPDPTNAASASNPPRLKMGPTSDVQQRRLPSDVTRLGSPIGMMSFLLGLTSRGWGFNTLALESLYREGFDDW